MPGIYTLIFDPGNDGGTDVQTLFTIREPVETVETIALEEVVNGTIAEAGDTARYTLTIPDDGQFFFDSYTNTDSLHWNLYRDGIAQEGWWTYGTTLDGPFGMRGTDDPRGLRKLTAGTYEIVIEGNGDFVGDFSFAMRSLANRTALADNTAATQTVENGARDYYYGWDATAGDIIELDVLTSGTNRSFSIYDPNGDIVLNDANFSDRSNMVLRQTGAYTFVVKGRPWNPDATSFAFAVRKTGVQAADPLAGTEFAIGEEVGATLVSAATPYLYTFTLTERTRLAVDMLTNSNRLWISVNDAYGKILNERRFDTSPNQYYDRPDLWVSPATLELGPGTYQVAVRGTADGDSYGFQFIDLNAAPLLAIGETETVTLNPANETTAIAIDAVLGDQVEIVIEATGEYHDWQLLNARGESLATGLINGTGIVSFDPAIAGRYTLLLAGRQYNVTPRTVTFTRLDGAAEAYEPGTIAHVAMPASGSRERFAFTVGEAGRFAVNMRYSTNNGTFQVRDAEGRIVLDTLRFDSRGTAPWFDAVAGTYVLEFFGYGRGALDFDFQIVAFNDADPITLGEPVQTALAAASDTRAYSFQGTAGQKVVFDHTAGSQTGYTVYFTDPDGSIIASRGYNDLSPVLLPKSGKYTLYVSPPANRYDPSTLAFRLIEQPVATRSLEFGERVLDSFADAGGRLIYDFSVAETSDVFFDGNLNDTAIRFTIRDSDGRVIRDARITDGGDAPLAYLQAGNYTLTLYRTDDQAGPVAFRLLNLKEAPEIVPGTLVRTSLDPGSVANAYRFAGEAGQRVVLDVATRFTDVSWRLLDSNGNTIASGGDFADAGPFILPRTDDYALLIGGDNNKSSSAELFWNLIEFPFRNPIVVDDRADPSADVEAQDLAVTATGLPTAGEPINISWTTTNNGSEDAAAGFDRVVIRRTDTDEIIAVRIVDAAALAAGASATRQTTIVLPAGQLGVGDFRMELELDFTNAVDETDGGLAGEENNTATLNFAALAPQLPDLQVTDIRTEPADGFAEGQTVTVRWTTTNTGATTINQAFTEQLRIVNPSIWQAPELILPTPLVYDPVVDGAIAAGESSRAQHGGGVAERHTWNGRAAHRGSDRSRRCHPRDECRRRRRKQQYGIARHPVGARSRRRRHGPGRCRAAIRRFDHPDLEGQEQWQRGRDGLFRRPRPRLQRQPSADGLRSAHRFPAAERRAAGRRRKPRHQPHREPARRRFGCRTVPGRGLVRLL